MRPALLGIAAALALGGCAGLAAPKPAPAGSPHELPSPPPPAQHAAGAVSAPAAVRAFAGIYVNWTWRDVAARMAMLARASVGQARSELQLAAAQADRDSTIFGARVSNRGTVEAVAPRSGHRDELVVVTRESTTAARSASYQGLAPAWHVTVATVAPLRGPEGARWVVSAWQPES